MHFLNRISDKLHSYGYVGSAIPLLEDRLQMVTELQTHEKENVVSFANFEIEKFTADLERAKREDENYNIGEI